MEEKINKNYTFTYNNHHTPGNLENSFIILRNPIERFTSGTIDYWSTEPGIKFLVSIMDRNTPEKWVQLWKNPSHPHRKNLLDEILNNSNLNHKVGPKIFRI